MSALERLLDAIGYPDGRPEGGASSFTIRVDGMEIEAEEAAGAITLKYVLTDNEQMLGQLAAYAAGRMLKEEATLSWDEQRGAAGTFRIFIWQAADAGAAPRELTRLFESFTNSCDWWRERVGALGDEKEEERKDEFRMPV